MTELEGLLEINDKISKLKKERKKKYGKYWNRMIVGYTGYKRWNKKTTLKYARKMEEYIALNGLSNSNAERVIGLGRGTFYTMQKHTLNRKNQVIIEAFFNDA